VSGKRLMTAFLAVVAVFAAALVYFQFFAFYERSAGLTVLEAGGRTIAVAEWEGIDAATSPLKRRACFRADPAAFAVFELAPDAEPLVAPFWFRCFDARTIAEDLAAGRAAAHVLERDVPAGFDLMAAVYPDGRVYLWRQLGAAFRRN
jgi:hypothetical protein